MKLKQLLVVLLALAAGPAVSQELYRYIDENGLTILNSVIPSAYVNNGYEIIDATGKVVQVVPPAEAVEPEFVLEKADTVLLASYSSVREIQEHRKRKIDSMESEIANIETDKRVLNLQMEKEIAERDRILKIATERELSERLAEQLKDLRTNIRQMQSISRQLDAQLSRRAENVEEIGREYAVKIERFIQLNENQVKAQQNTGSSTQ